MSAEFDQTLREAERIAGLLEKQGLPGVVIGAAALAAHRYLRFTRDIDLGVDADLWQMRGLVEVLRAAGYDSELHEPGGDDPLGGVIDPRIRSWKEDGKCKSGQVTTEDVV